MPRAVPSAPSAPFAPFSRPDTSGTPPPLPMLARNVTHFMRLLRDTGFGLSPAHAVDALEALRHIDIGARDEVRAALAALVLSGPDQRPLFDAAFDLFWRDPDWESKLRAMLLPRVDAGIPPPRRSNRLADALAWMARGASDRFELVFIDPPFDADLFVPALNAARACCSSCS